MSSPRLNVELFDYFYFIKYDIDVVTCFGLECSYCFFGRWNPDARGGFLHKFVHLKVLILLLHICQKVCMCVIFHILHMQSLLGMNIKALFEFACASLIDDGPCF